MQGEVPTPEPGLENEVRLKPGINVIPLPDFTKPAQNHPDVSGGEKTPSIPLTAEEVCIKLERFLRSLEEQGGLIVSMPTIAVTTNDETARYAQNAKIADKTFVVISK